MDYRRMGRSGLKVSEICLGTMTFGHGADEAESGRIGAACVDAGVNFLDTANTYNAGVSENMVGHNLGERGKDGVVAWEGKMWVATGTTGRPSEGTGTAGLNKSDGKTGNVVMTVDFEKGSCDPHGLGWHDGQLVSSDAGLHPGWNWQNGDQSPTSGYIFSIEIV